MNIIFTCSGRRNDIILWFKEIIGDTGKTIALDYQASATSLQVADIGIIVPKVSDDNYITELKKIIVEYKADLLIPLNDLELSILSKHRISLEELGVKVIISNKNIIDITLDKWKSFNFLESAGIHTPKTFLTVKEALSSIESNEICFPLIIKPRWGSGSAEIYTARNKKELRLSFNLLKLKQDSLNLQKLNEGNDPNFIIIQEFLTGQEYGMDILNDFNGNFVDVFIRKKIAMRAGETDKALTIDDEKYKNIGKKLAIITSHLGLMDCDFFVRNDKVYILEMNPRFGGGYPFSHTAGVNVPAIYLSWLLGNNNIKKHLNYEAGLFFAKYNKIMPIRDLPSQNQDEPSVEQHKSVLLDKY
jgi:carbamoyl-phosphate synthase large subunit